MTEHQLSECITTKELDKILTSDQYYSEPEVIDSIFNIPKKPLPDDVQQEILRTYTERGEPLPSLGSLIPTNMTASGIMSHLVSAGLPCVYSSNGMVFDTEVIRIFFLDHGIALPSKLFPASPSNSERKLKQLLDQRIIRASLVEKTRARQRDLDEQEERELRRLKLEEARARAEAVKTGSTSIISDGCINVYEDSDLRHDFLIRVAVLEELSTDLGFGFSKGNELEDALQQFDTIIDTVNKKPSVHRDDTLKELIKLYLNCWLSRDNTTPEYTILQHRLSRWRVKYLIEQPLAIVEARDSPTGATRDKSIVETNFSEEFNKTSSLSNNYPASTANEWSQIHVKFVGMHAIEIHHSGKSEYKTFDEIGFSDRRRKDEPNSQWTLLRLIAENRGEITPHGDITKQISNLRKSLKCVFPHLNGDPIKHEPTRRAYIVTFSISSNIPRE